MIYERLNTLKDKLVSENPIFEGNGFVVDKFNDGGFVFFNDRLQNYFFLDSERPLQKDSHGNGDEFSIQPAQQAGALQISGRFRLIAIFDKKVNTMLALEALLSQLYNLKVVPYEASIDTQAIFQDEALKNLPATYKMVRIRFVMTTHVGKNFNIACSNETLCEEC